MPGRGEFNFMLCFVSQRLLQANDYEKISYMRCFYMLVVLPKGDVEVYIL